MRIVVQDFSGHPFQVQLSRALAEAGHEVVHTFCPDFTSGQGSLQRRHDDPDNLAIVPIPLGRTFDKYRLRKRVGQELRYGWRLSGFIRSHRPDVFLSCNEPLLAKTVLGVSCRLTGQRSVYWLQDIYSVAMRRELVARAGRTGGLIGSLFIALESWLIKVASGVVVITPAFGDWIRDRGIRQPNVTVIPNWAPLDELPYHETDQHWFESIGIPRGAPVALYSGTLGLKHNALALEQVARRLRAGGGHVVVISEGDAADRVAEAARSLPNLHVLPFQPWSEVPSVLASATVLMAILEAEAGSFSVPSKVLTYLCAGRPIVASIPSENLAATMIQGEAGFVTPPGDADALAEAVAMLCDDRSLAETLGRKARALAEQSFDIEPIAQRFLEVLRPTATGPAPTA